MGQYDVDLRDYWRIMRKRKASILAMALLVGLCSYGFAKLREPVPLYEAGSAIKIDRFSNLASILTGAHWRQSENMETHAYIITSHPVLQSAAAELGWIPAAGEVALRAESLVEPLERLKRMVQAKPQEGTHIINIRAVSEDPELSARVANSLATAYRDYTIRQNNKKTSETRAFIEEQLRQTSARLKTAERELQAFKESHGLIALDTQTNHTLNKLNAVQTEHEKVRAERAEIDAQLKAIDAAGQGQPDRLTGVMSAAAPGSPLGLLRGKLSELNLKRQTLLISFTEKHPQVEEATSEIRAVFREARSELQAAWQAAANREAELGRRLEALQRENMSLPEKGLALVRLQRELELQESLYSQLKAKYQEVQIQESGRVEEVFIVKPALAPSAPFNIPSKLMIVATGVLMGLIIGVVLAFLAEVFDTSMGTIEDVEELLKVPVLGVIPQLEGEGRKAGRAERADGARNRSGDLVAHFEPKSQAAESFRALRTNLQFLRLESKGQLFLITSSFVQEGKTLNVVNLALCMAQAGNRVLLVDADLRKPSIHRVFGLSREPGITDCVLGNYHWREVVGSISDIMLGDFEIEEILKTPGMDKLHIVSAGTKPPNPTEILSSVRFREFLQEARQHYDFIFVDAPPILPVADATEIAPLMDGVFLVYTVGRIGRGVLKRAKSNLDNVDARVMGIVLNNVKPEAGPDYFRYHSHYYYGPDHEGAAARKAGPGRPGWRWPAGLAKAAGALALLLVLSVFMVNALWPDMSADLPAWLKPYAQLLTSN
ncbi:MAG: polysaccharide biosynthesis tyrosine autokinase [Desulfobacterales bacterium]|nr:polysaccharide biosynthesis tyrosine autokinase [Desulfobacterales bacterium]